MRNDNLLLCLDTVKLKLREMYEAKWYLHFLMNQFTKQECCMFAAPFIKDDPVTENLTIYQPYSLEQLWKIMPEDREFCHVVLEYWSCDTAEKAYLWAKQFLRDAGVSTFSVIVIHYFRGNYHAHLLISAAYPQPSDSYTPFFPFFPSHRQIEEAARRIPVEADKSISDIFCPYVIFDDSLYGNMPQKTL